MGKTYAELLWLELCLSVTLPGLSLETDTDHDIFIISVLMEVKFQKVECISICSSLNFTYVNNYHSHKDVGLIMYSPQHPSASPTKTLAIVW
jgi:hypothetical protein